MGIYLRRYTTSKGLAIKEIDPKTGTVLKTIDDPQDKDFNRCVYYGGWEEYFRKIFLVYYYKTKFIFQEGGNRFELDTSYTAIIDKGVIRKNRFRLFKNKTLVYDFRYRDPQTRFWSIIDALTFNDDWWDWGNPFDEVKNYLDGLTNEI